MTATNIIESWILSFNRATEKRNRPFGFSVAEQSSWIILISQPSRNFIKRAISGRSWARPTRRRSAAYLRHINSWREKNFGCFSRLEKFSIVGRCFAIRATSNCFSITVLPRKRHISLILNLKRLDFGGRTSPTFREYSAHRTEKSHQSRRKGLLLGAWKPKERMSPKWLVYG